MLNRVNDFGDPHPHPRYQGWFYNIYGTRLWTRFRFTFDGKFEKHKFMVGLDATSPLGAANFLTKSVSERGKKCVQGYYIIPVIISISYLFENSHYHNYDYYLI